MRRRVAFRAGGAGGQSQGNRAMWPVGIKVEVRKDGRWVEA